MFQAALIAIGIGLAAVATASDKAKSRKATTPPAGDGKATPPGETKVKTPEEWKAEGKAEALEEVKRQSKAERDLARRVARLMGNSPRARVVPATDDSEEDAA